MRLVGQTMERAMTHLIEYPTTGSPEHQLPLVHESLGALILNRAATTGADTAFDVPSEADWKSLTWSNVVDRATEVAAGLIALGLQSQDRVAIACGTRIEWIIADYANMLSGCATTTVYPGTGAEDVTHILQDSGARVLFAEDQSEADKALANRDSLPAMTHIVLLCASEKDVDHEASKGTGTPAIITLPELQTLGQEHLAQHADAVTARVSECESTDLATLIYTSGTTGRPKGVELTHGNWLYAGHAMASLGIITGDDIQLLWLPLSHSFGKLLLSSHLVIGGVAAVDGRLDRIVQNLSTVRPTYMAAAPRILEKVHARVNGQAEQSGRVRAAVYDWAFRTGAEARDRRLAGTAVGVRLQMQLSLADALVFRRIRDRLGGRLRYLFSGSAPLSPDIAEWFDIAGIPVVEGYALTETSAATCVNRPDHFGPGAVGLPLPGTEVAIAPDGEILVRGPSVMRGYRNRPDANEEVFGTHPGWFATGDIGVIDEGGRIQIRDRKKDLVKTSGGKYIALGAIEAQFKSVCSVVDNVVVIASGRNFASALVTLDPEATQDLLLNDGSAGTNTDSLADDPRVHRYIAESFDELNASLNRWETIKTFRVLPGALTVESGELTPSLKVKRKVVESKYSDLIDEIYRPRSE